MTPLNLKTKFQNPVLFSGYRGVYQEQQTLHQHK